MGGGGGRGEGYVPALTKYYERGTELDFARGRSMQGRGRFRVILMVYHAIWALFLSILIFFFMD